MTKRKYTIELRKGKNGYRVRITAPNGRIIESAAGQQYSRKVDALRTIKNFAAAVMEERVIIKDAINAS